MLHFLEQEMETTKIIFDRNVKSKQLYKSIPVHRNMPDISGLLKWSHELIDRIEKPMKTFEKLIKHPIKNSIEMSRVRKKHDELLHIIDQYVLEPFENWCKIVAKVCKHNLEKNLILRNPKTRVITTNFDPKLVAIITEVKYLGKLKEKLIPTEAKEIFEKSDEYLNYTTCLDYTVDSYNRMFKISTREEMELISDELKIIDTELAIGEYQLQWNTPGISEYIIEIRSRVNDLESRLKLTKINVEKVRCIMNTWKDTPLFKRLEHKSTLLQLDDKQIRINNRYREIEEGGKKIHELVNVGKYFKLKEFYLKIKNYIVV